jgi:peroxiredoxin
MEREQPSSTLSLGKQLPDFELPSTSGNRISGTEFFTGAKAALVAFTCNHCPYVKGSELQLIEIAKRHMPNGLRVLTISSNDAAQYPEDGFDKMKEHTRELSLPYPYLYDESQEVAKLFDAACTPEFYLFDGSLKLVYHGTINDSPRDPSKVTKNYLEDAVMQVLEGQTPDPSFVHPLGCSIKWKR